MADFENIDISYRSVCAYVSKQAQRSKRHLLGKFMSLDKWLNLIGEMLLFILRELGAERRFKIGVFDLKYSDKRFAYLYSHENTEAFLDIHTRFFEEIKGVPTEIVYDNARVQV